MVVFPRVGGFHPSTFQTVFLLLKRVTMDRLRKAAGQRNSEIPLTYWLLTVIYQVLRKNECKLWHAIYLNNYTSQTLKPAPSSGLPDARRTFTTADRGLARILWSPTLEWTGWSVRPAGLMVLQGRDLNILHFGYHSFGVLLCFSRLVGLGYFYSRKLGLYLTVDCVVFFFQGSSYKLDLTI